MERISKKLGLAKSKVYKWNWDKKKQFIIPSKVCTSELEEGKIYLKGDTNEKVEICTLMKASKTLSSIQKEAKE